MAAISHRVYRAHYQTCGYVCSPQVERRSNCILLRYWYAQGIKYFATIFQANGRCKLVLQWKCRGRPTEDGSARPMVGGGSPAFRSSGRMCEVCYADLARIINPTGSSCVRRTRLGRRSAPICRLLETYHRQRWVHPACHCCKFRFYQ